MDEKYYRAVPRFNLIPPEYLRGNVSIYQLLLCIFLVLVIGGGGLAVSSFYREKSDCDSDIEAVKGEIEAVEVELRGVIAETGEAEELIAAIGNLKREYSALEDERRQGQLALQRDWEELGGSQADWPQVLAALFYFTPAEVQLSILDQDGTEVSISGNATSYPALLQYQRSVLASPVISQITSLRSETAGHLIPFSLVATVRRVGE